MQRLSHSVNEYVAIYNNNNNNNNIYYSLVDEYEYIDKDQEERISIQTTSIIWYPTSILQRNDLQPSRTECLYYGREFE